MGSWKNLRAHCTVGWVIFVNGKLPLVLKWWICKFIVVPEIAKTSPMVWFADIFLNHSKHTRHTDTAPILHTASVGLALLNSNSYIFRMPQAKTIVLQIFPLWSLHATTITKNCLTYICILKFYVVAQVNLNYTFKVIGPMNLTAKSWLSNSVLWIQIHWIWIRIQDFEPIWIRIQVPIPIQGCTINFEWKN